MFKKTLFITALGIVTSLMPATSLAQRSIDDALNPIKNELQQEDIAVIDFSIEQGQWGALPREVVSLMIENGFEEFSDFANLFEAEFEEEGGIKDLQYRLGILEAEKTQAVTSQEREDIESAMEEITNDIAILEEDIKEEIEDEAFPIDYEEILEMHPILADFFSAPDTEGITNAIFRELRSYYSQVKWGSLSYPVSHAILSDDDLWEGELDRKERSIAVLAKLYGNVEDLRELLEQVEYPNLEGELISLTENQINQIIAQVQASQFEGERQINQVVLSAVTFLRNLIGSLAVLWIIVSGARMVTSQDESVITEQKRGILYAVIGLVVILLIERIIALLYGSTGALRETLAPSEAFDAEIYGVVNFIRSVIGMISVLYVVRAGFLSIIAQGEEEKITQNRKAIVYIVIGLIIIAINRVIIENLFIEPVTQDSQISSSNVARIIDTFGLVLQFVLGFVGVIALAALVYGAALLIMNYGGSDEIITKAKTIMRNAIIGIIVIIAAFTIVSTLVVFR